MGVPDCDSSSARVEPGGSPGACRCWVGIGGTLTDIASSSSTSSSRSSTPPPAGDAPADGPGLNIPRAVSLVERVGLKGSMALSG